MKIFYLLVVLLLSSCIKKYSQVYDFTPIYNLDTNNYCSLYAFELSCVSLFEDLQKLDCYNKPEFVDLDGLKFAQAKQSIIAESEKYNFIIINENHLIPNHRLFVETMLDEFKTLGYSTLFVETLTSNDTKDSVLNNSKKLDTKSGFYTNEPRFANFIKRALLQDFVCLSYESNGHKSPLEREINQANYIFEVINKKNIKKAIIYCGFGHGLENTKGGRVTMASRLKSLVNEDILSIDQTNYYFESNFIKTPVIIDSINIPGFDFTIIHPKATREGWLHYDNLLTKIEVPKPKDFNYPFYVYAYINDDYQNRVPCDALLIVDDRPIYFYLKRGSYSVIFNNSSKSLKFKLEI